MQKSRLLLICLISFLPLELFAICGPAQKEAFTAKNVLTCPIFATALLGRVDYETSRKIRSYESLIRSEIIKNKLAADIQIKVGVEIVSPEEVWFHPEMGLFYSHEEDLKVVNQILLKTPLKKTNLLKDDVSVYGIFQGYVSKENQEQEDSDTFMSANEWISFEGQERLKLYQELLELVSKLQKASTLLDWKILLETSLPKDHYLDWNIIEQTRNNKLHLSTYFDYQWYSHKYPDNGTLTTELIEEFETEFVHIP